MFFKKIAVLLLLPCLLSCQLPINESPAIVQPPVAKLSDRCLSDVLPNMEKFMQGEADEKMVSNSWLCFQNGLKMFLKNVEGEKYRDKFTAREIATFFEDSFLDENIKINDKLLQQIFYLKQLFVGGNTDSMTRIEVEQLGLFAEKVRLLSLRLLPYMKVYSFNWLQEFEIRDDSKVEFFESANLALQQAAKELAEVFAKNPVSYKIEYFYELLFELQNLYGESWSFTKEFRKLLPIVLKLKKSLAGGDESVIASNEWRRFSLIGSRGYVQYLRYFYFLKGVDKFGNGPELTFLFRSIDDLFSYLGDMVREKPGGLFFKSELYEVLDSLSNFFPKVKVTEELVNQGMKIKVLIFGGDNNVLKPEEFDYARTKVSAFKSVASRIIEYANVYGLSWEGKNFNQDARKLYVIEATKNFRSAASDLSVLLDTQYDLADLLILGGELDKLNLQSGGEKRSLEALAKQYVPLVISAKNLIVSDQGSVVSRSQWVKLFDWIAQSYNHFIYYHYFVADSTFLYGDGLDEVEGFVKRIASLLKEFLQTKPAFQIHLTEIYGIINGFSQAQMFDSRVKSVSINKLANMVVQKMMISPEERLAGVEQYAINQKSLNYLMSEFDLWVLGQRTLEEFLKISGGEKQIVEHKQMQDFWNAAADSQIKTEFRLIFDSVLPMTTYNETVLPNALSGDNRINRLYMSYKEAKYTVRNVGIINLFRSLVRILVRSYSGDLNNIKSYKGINFVEARNLYNDVRGFFEDIELLDPRTDTFVKNRYRDGNLFTSAADGDDSFLSYKEAFDLVLMIFSGIAIDDELSTYINDRCPFTPAQYKQDQTVKLPCLLEVYGERYKTAFEQMPDLVKAFSLLSAEDLSAKFVDLLKAAGYEPDGTDNIKKGDLSLFPFVVQYLETSFLRYDQGANDPATMKDGLLSTDEAIAAFPIFLKTFRTIVNDPSVDDDKLMAAFTYILKRAKMPKDKKDLAPWILAGRKNWRLKEDRMKLAKVFGILADELSKSGGGAPNDPKKIPEALLKDVFQ